MIRFVVNCGTRWCLTKGSNPPTDYTELGINITMPYSAETDHILWSHPQTILQWDKKCIKKVHKCQQQKLHIFIYISIQEKEEEENKKIKKWI